MTTLPSSSSGRLTVNVPALVDAVNILRSCSREAPEGFYRSVVGVFEGVEYHLIAVGDPTHQLHSDQGADQLPLQFG
ncbi:hypothetical protein [Pararhodospirillum photometricum]|uniref:Uncharacterized protein n=1 Tax=Pararhodospirillum photometricum DSM 122 TaxID=1150469 RepID=H6SNX6_PARPM|nr:hypothetical protein [Pararhodospirillum photometricum]CCG07048.1 unnamed protein product [Pararhodospirillum photometricum DSM 122]